MDRKIQTLLDRIYLAQIGSCTCTTKTHVIEDHSENCRYRILGEAAAMLQDQHYERCDTCSKFLDYDEDVFSANFDGTCVVCKAALGDSEAVKVYDEITINAMNVLMRGLD
jgi:hypothetical protein